MKTKNLLILIISLTLPMQGFAASYEEGREAYLAKDYEKALSILRPKANQGHQKSQVTLGTMYDFGHGVKQDPLKAIEWFEKAAAQGNSFVQHDLGVKYFKGMGIPQDYDRAAAWWRMAADNGVAESQYNLGLMYARGLGFQKDSGMAVNWYSKAASQGHANAQYSLGVMYSFGQGVSQDYVKGLSYFQDAAEKNLPQAQYNLAVLLENGRGTEVDLPSAKKWYQKAAAGGIEQATTRLAAFDQNHSKPPAEEPVVVTKKEVVEKVAETEEVTEEVTSNIETKPAESNATTNTVTMEQLDTPEPKAPSINTEKNIQMASGTKVEELKPETKPTKAVAAVKPKEKTESAVAKKVLSGESKQKNAEKSLDKNWIVSQKPTYYSLQMIAFNREENARRYMENLDLDGPRALYKSSMHGKTIYKVIYGRYDDHRASLKGRRALPKKYRDAKPFPRSFEFIQSDIKE